VSEVREDLSVEELAALVCSTLERHGVRVVLSGGSDQRQLLLPVARNS
jgi:hypothetical protein